MSDVVQPKVIDIDSLGDLEKAAKQAAEQLTKASSENAVWDKALKALQPVLAALPAVLPDAQNAAKQAEAFVKKLENNHKSILESVQAASTLVDKDIQPLDEKPLTEAKKKAADAQKALDESIAKFDTAQKNLLELPKKIQEGKKALLALKAEVEDADDKKQEVEAILKLQRLNEMLGKFNDLIKPKYETGLWKALDAAAREVLQKTEALQAAQADVPQKRTDYNKAKTRYEDAQKNRLDNIKKQVDKAKGG